MKCPLCNLEMRITASRYVVEHDDTPSTPTKLYQEMDLTCVNEKCPNNGTVVETIRNELDLNG